MHGLMVIKITECDEGIDPSSTMSTFWKPLDGLSSMPMVTRMLPIKGMREVKICGGVNVLEIGVTKWEADSEYLGLWTW